MYSDRIGNPDGSVLRNNNLGAPTTPTTPTVLLPQARPLSPTGIMAAFADNRMMYAATVEGMREHYRSLLVKDALGNVAALSALEEHLRVVAPLGSERYRIILDSYCFNLAARLSKG